MAAATRASSPWSQRTALRRSASTSRARAARATSLGRYRCSRSRTADRRAHLLPRRRDAVPALRASARVRRVARPFVRQHTRQAHELDQLEERLRRVLEAHRTAASHRGELETRERVDRHRIRLDAGHVTNDDAADLARTARDRRGRGGRRDGSGRGWRRRPRAARCRHRSLDGRNRRKLSGRHARSATELLEPWARHTPSSSTDEIRRVGGSLPAATNRGVWACPSSNDSQHTNDCRPAVSRAGCARAPTTRGESSSRWLAITAVLIVLVATVGGSLKDEFEIPGSDTQKRDGSHRVAVRLRAGLVLNLVFAAPVGQRLDTPGAQGRDRGGDREARSRTSSSRPRTGPGSTASATRSARTRFSDSGRIAYAEAQFDRVIYTKDRDRGRRRAGRRAEDGRARGRDRRSSTAKPSRRRSSRGYRSCSASSPPSSCS